MDRQVTWFRAFKDSINQPRGLAVLLLLGFTFLLHLRFFARALGFCGWFGAWAKRDLQSFNSGSERRRLNTKKLGSAA